jgi:NAD(P)-dependent dehydrogenase (short-subunit alcohol dehydrogenase family)
MGQLADKVVLIAGGGAEGPKAAGERIPIGNGRATAITCAREGAMVMVADRRLDAAEETVAAIRAEGHRAESVACDITDSDQCRAAVAATVAAFSGIDLLVNNVGIGDFGTVADTPSDAFDRLMHVNVRGHFLTIKHALPEMAKRGGGAIVNVSSLNAYRSGGAGIGYETSKAALLGLTRNVSVTAAELNVRVNTVIPGVIDSALLRRHVGDQKLDLASRIPLRRLGTPWEVAGVIVFLLSDEASYVTGTEVVVDGGMNVPL